ncbi:MAG: phosphate propanoyltransferase [Oscillospiraceae bacterium]|nr:phosphate propanoyltransferase [Oscillospiraceae bacterium]
MKVLIETSARHVHLTEKDMIALFGEGAKLSIKKELSQPGQFASNERVTLVGPKRSIENVIIIGPVRSKSQVEISLTDARSLGVKAPVRLSGDIKDSGSCKLVGPAGEVELSEGVIIAKRHIHMRSQEAKAQGLKDNDQVMIKLETQDRSLIFDDVIIRVDDNFNLAMHIDTDEANAAGCVCGMFGEIIKK